MFAWFGRKEKRITGKEVDLVLERSLPFFGDHDHVPTYIYGIYLHGTGNRIGSCDLRCGMNPEIYYVGNIGYRIHAAYRGHRYAEKACRLLFTVARQKRMRELLITCSPENTASRMTLEHLGGELLETTDVPRSHWLYERGEIQKNIYRFQLL